MEVTTPSSPLRRLLRRFSPKGPSSFFTPDNSASPSQSTLINRRTAVPNSSALYPLSFISCPLSNQLLPGEELLLLVYCDLIEAGCFIPGELIITSFALRFRPASSLVHKAIIIPIASIDTVWNTSLDLNDSKISVMEISTKLTTIIRVHFDSSVKGKNQSKSTNSDRSRVLQLLTSRMDPTQPVHCFFAFNLVAPSLTSSAIDGWKIYDPLREFRRLGMTAEDSSWRVCTANSHYEISATYPKLFIVPKDLCDEEVRAVSQFRVKGRLPVAMWMHQTTKATLWRCSQPRSGLVLTRRSPADERLVRAIVESVNRDEVVEETPCDLRLPLEDGLEGLAILDEEENESVESGGVEEADQSNLIEYVLPEIPSCQRPVLIIDCRPRATAVLHGFLGAGTETNFYKDTQLLFADIPNIHVVRESFKKLKYLVDVERTSLHSRTPSNAGSLVSKSHASPVMLPPAVCKAVNRDSKFLTALDQTNWLRYIQLILAASTVCAQSLCDGVPVIVHCTHGFDRTSQVSALSQLMADSYYRTIHGFAVLVEKEFGTSGAPLGKRSIGKDLSQRSPIFIQFLDCVFQILSQYSESFEYTEEFLRALAILFYSGSCGTFLFDCEKDRIENKASEHTVSVWNLLAMEGDRFVNKNYCPHSTPVWPKLSSMYIRLWRSLYLGSEVSEH
ncbi:hypothetical protein P9112_001984 [Eukaryota sp. TZLM1-RC]